MPGTSATPPTPAGETSPESTAAERTRELTADERLREAIMGAPARAGTAGGPPRNPTPVAPAPGWLLDGNGQNRWWDGTGWTEHVRPSAAPTASGSLYLASGAGFRSLELSAKNGPATAALVLILIQVLPVGFLLVLASGFDPVVFLLVAALSGLTLITTLVLAVIGVVVAVRRPTKKKRPVTALVFALLLFAFVVGRAITAVPTVDVGSLETSIAGDASVQVGETVEVDCPDPAPSAAGSIFVCTASGATGAVWMVEVTVGSAATTTWQLLQV